MKHFFLRRDHDIIQNLYRLIKNIYFYAILVGIATFLLVFFIVVTSIAPKRYDLKVGELATETIKATKDIVDEITTHKRIKEVQNTVDVKYKQDEAITNNVIGEVNTCFGGFTQIRIEGEKEKLRRFEKTVPEPSPAGISSTKEKNSDKNLIPNQVPVKLSPIYDDDFLNRMSEKLPIAFSKMEILSILNASSSELEILKTQLISMLTVRLENGIKEEFRLEQINKVNQELQDPSLKISNEIRMLGMSIVSISLKANMFYDQEATEAAKQKAALSLESTVYKKGQNIVLESEPITEAQLKVLDNLGLLKSKAFDITMYVGLGFIILLLMVTIALYIFTFERELITHISHLILLGIIICLVLGIAGLVNKIHGYLIPVSLGALLITILLSPRLALVTNIVLSILVGIIAGNSEGMLTIPTLNIILIAIVGGMIGVYLVNYPQQRATLSLAGILIGVANVFTIVGIGLMTTNDVKGILLSSLWGLGNGILAGILCIGTLPIWENIFDLVTPVKLLELSNPNQPLLQRLLMEAPGTYYHSIIVANLSESAAHAIGGNTLLTRVGAYYHDVGKLKRPYFFKENQMGSDNPHDKITPHMSTLVITSHTRDGIQYAQKYKLPKIIQDIILQHHGTTPVQYFYYKAYNTENGNDVNLDDFRYNGPHPQSREAAIIMMADTVEAAVRALSEPTKGKVEGLIRKLIKEKLEDGQLDECNLTLGDLGKIAMVFSKVLTGVFHERIEYPETNSKQIEGADKL